MKSVSEGRAAAADAQLVPVNEALLRAGNLSSFNICFPDPWSYVVPQQWRKNFPLSIVSVLALRPAPSLSSFVSGGM